MSCIFSIIKYKTNYTGFCSSLKLKKSQAWCRRKKLTEIVYGGRWKGPTKNAHNTTGQIIKNKITWKRASMSLYSSEDISSLSISFISFSTLFIQSDIPWTLDKAQNTILQPYCSSSLIFHVPLTNHKIWFYSDMLLLAYEHNKNDIYLVFSVIKSVKILMASRS